MPTRRSFIGHGVRAGAAMAMLPRAATAKREWFDTADEVTRPARHPLRILILGGTSFIGPHQIAYALGRGHTVTTFTRGRTEPTVHRRLLGEVEARIGDREGDLSALETGSWDAVIDNSGRRVEWTTRAAELLRDRVDLYVYTSSTGVYYPYLGADIGEDTDVALSLPDGIEAGADGAYDYGIMKARSEAEARRIFGDDRVIVVRPTYMMGPGDTTDRFIHWPVRLAEGGDVVVPGRPDDPVQYIDARDAAEWTVRLIEQRTTGTYNAAGPASATGVRAFVHGAHAAFSSAARFVEIPDYDFLSEHRVRAVVPWIMPVGNNSGSARIDIGRARAAGLTFRPLATSVREMYDWWRSDAVADERRERLATRGLLARESEVLSAWRQRADRSP